jgi:nitrate/nitrite-specific signal transduction histidine kinase
MTDELTGLAETLNKILDELTIQYNLLEEQVAELTQKLGKAKIAADSTSSDHS